MNEYNFKLTTKQLDQLDELFDAALRGPYKDLHSEIQRQIGEQDKMAHEAFIERAKDAEENIRADEREKIKKGQTDGRAKRNSNAEPADSDVARRSTS